MRRRVHEILTHSRPDDRLGRFINIGLLFLIGVNVTASILESDTELAASAPSFFLWFERISVAVFSIEYLLRLWSCTADPRFAGTVRGRLRMAVSPMALIDLVAIAPFYLELLLPGALDLRFLRVLRLLRLFRLLRYPSVIEAFATMARVLQHKRIELAVSLAMVIIAMLLAAGAMFIAERDQPGTLFTSIPRAMWWAVETITTIGYGDMIPTTSIGKVIGGIVAFIGICAVALPVGIVSSGFIDELNRKRRLAAAHTEIRTCPHCGGVIDP